MKVICLYQDGSEICKDISTQECFEQHGCNPKTTFGGVSVGDEYICMGVFLNQNKTHYLIATDEQQFHFYPAALFEVIDPRLGRAFHIKKFKEEFVSHDLLFDFSLVISYSEMVNNPNHFGELLDYQYDALKYFTRSYWQMMLEQ